MAIGAAGFLAVPNSSAGGTVPPLVAGAGSSVTCSVAGPAKLAPALADDWIAADHASDPTAVPTWKAAIASIPTHTYASFGPVSTSAKIGTVAGSCTGTVTDDGGATHETILSGKLAALSVSGDNVTEATCGGLASAATGGGEDGPQTFDSVISWTSVSGRKIAPSDIHATLKGITAGGTGFGLESGPAHSADGGLAGDITGSFGGGSSETKAYIDAVSLTALTIATFEITPSIAHPDLGDVCEPTASIKTTTASDTLGALTSDGISIKVKKPKGLKSIVLGNTAAQGCVSSCHDSTITISR